VAGDALLQALLKWIVCQSTNFNHSASFWIQKITEIVTFDFQLQIVDESKLCNDSAPQIKHILLIKIYWYGFSHKCFT
jgi:hypothetical protein